MRVIVAVDGDGARRFGGPVLYNSVLRHVSATIVTIDNITKP
jgi:hypothetical protein